ncbi:unnamed protein product [Durusdinium trenchii]|uniref:Uncharacterized protein n=1 Tax=Durusdinium trenchii TaxID=1381693 RepID=A0ABP0JIR5_9DINO
MAVMAMAAMLMHFASSQGAGNCSAPGCDDVSILQVTARATCTWKLSALGGNCVRACAPSKCDPSAQKRLQGAALDTVVQSLGRRCSGASTPSLHKSAPYITRGTNKCRHSAPQNAADSRCSASAASGNQRICCCIRKRTSTTSFTTSAFTTFTTSAFTTFTTSAFTTFTTAWPSTSTTSTGGDDGDPHISTIWEITTAS